MSLLSTINEPPLVTAMGLAAMTALPSLEAAIISGVIPWTAVQVVNCALYGLNAYATSQPGRITDTQAKQLAKGKQIKKKRDGVEEKGNLIADAANRSRTLVAPAGWAFAIWGPIFLGELIFCISHALLPEAAPVAAMVKRASAGFMTSQIMQTLWTASFRPRFKGKSVFVSAGLLSGIALSLSRAHAAFSSDRASYSSGQYWRYFFPMTMHFSWTTAACLVNWNGSLAACKGVGPQTLAIAGHLSVGAATALGVGVTLSRSAPVFGLVISWALMACTAGMNQRLQPGAESSNNNYFHNRNSGDEKRAGVYGARVQKWLCLAGACLSAAASPMALYSIKNGK